jgi:hypothetical protein
MMRCLRERGPSLTVVVLAMFFVAVLQAAGISWIGNRTVLR